MSHLIWDSQNEAKKILPIPKLPQEVSSQPPAGKISPQIQHLLNCLCHIVFPTFP